MSLVLDSVDVGRFQAANDALLSALEFDDLGAWAATVLRRVQELHRCDRTQLLVPVHGTLASWSEGIRPAGLRMIQEFIRDPAPGTIRVSDPVANHAFRLRQALGVRVFTYASMERLGGDALRRCPYHEEFMAPEGLSYCLGMRIPLPLGEANVNIAFSRPSDDPFGLESGAALLRMLLPAFSAAVRALRQLHDMRGTLESLVDQMQLPLALFGARGTLLHQTPALRAVLQAEPARLEIEQAMRSLANDLLMLRRPGSKTTRRAVRPVGRRELRSAGDRYRLRAAYLPQPGGADGAAIAVEVDHDGPRLPSAGELVSACGLTRREAEVALLLAAGGSDRDIGRRLDISPHTARKHAEHIFMKLHLHSRKALALQLVAATERAAMQIGQSARSGSRCC